MGSKTREFARNFAPAFNSAYGAGAEQYWREKAFEIENAMRESELGERRAAAGQMAARDTRDFTAGQEWKAKDLALRERNTAAAELRAQPKPAAAAAGGGNLRALEFIIDDQTSVLSSLEKQLAEVNAPLEIGQMGQVFERTQKAAELMQQIEQRKGLIENVRKLHMGHASGDPPAPRAPAAPQTAPSPQSPPTRGSPPAAQGETDPMAMMPSAEYPVGKRFKGPGGTTWVMTPNGLRPLPAGSTTQPATQPSR